MLYTKFLFIQKKSNAHGQKNLFSSVLDFILTFLPGRKYLSLYNFFFKPYPENGLELDLTCAERGLRAPDAAHTLQPPRSVQHVPYTEQHVVYTE